MWDIYGNWFPDPVAPTANLPPYLTDSISYPGPPTVNPPQIDSIVVDSNGEQFMYWGGAWH